MNWDLNSICAIARGLEFANQDEICIKDAAVILVNEKTLEIYRDFADNLCLSKDQLYDAICQGLTLTYSTFGSSQTRVKIFFYGGGAKADEYISQLNDTLRALLGDDLPDSQQDLVEEEMPVSSSQDFPEANPRAETGSEDPVNRQQIPCSRPSPRTMKKLLEDMRYLKESQRKNVKSFDEIKLQLKAVDKLVNKIFKILSDNPNLQDMIVNKNRLNRLEEPGSSTSMDLHQVQDIASDLKFKKFTSSKSAEDFFENKLAKLRSSIPWIKSIRTYRHDNIDIVKMRKLRSIIVVGPQKYGRFLNRILARLFGIKKMKDTLMVKHSARHLLRPGKDRARVFSSNDEKTLLDLLKKIDAEFFSDSQVWEELVRKKANQYGRDLCKRDISESEDDQELDSGYTDTDTD